jgi:large subunit ribosomal protein L21
MKYAVIAISGSQYQVKENQVITIDKIDLEEGKTSTTDQVLLFVDEDKIQVGSPLVDGAQVEFQVVKNYQGPKLDIFKYKAKSRYRRRMGFRAQLADIKITQISFGSTSKKSSNSPEAKVTKKAGVKKTVKKATTTK